MHWYHTGIALGVLEWGWDENEINYITLGWHLECWNEPGIRLGSIISHWVDTWSAEMSLGSGWNQLYPIGLTLGVLKWAWDQAGINYITLGWHLECWNELAIRVGSIILGWHMECLNELGIRVGLLISQWVDTWSAEMRLDSGWDQLYHTGLTPGVLEWD